MDQMEQLAADRLLARSHSEDTGYETPCFVENAAWKNGGYGRVYIWDGRRPPAHVFIYECLTGPIPEGHDIHHLCETQSCWRKEHLEAVPVPEHRRISRGFAGDNARKTHCPQGHEYTGTNLYVNSRGGRVCRQCVRDATKRYRERERASVRERSR